MRGRGLLPLAFILLAVAGCGADATLTVSADGRIGPLRMDRSGAQDVLALLGQPDADIRGRYALGAPYRALGFECSRTDDDSRFPLERGAFCRTVFFVNLRTGTLGNFFTTSHRYEERHGLRIGMSTAVAERLIHKRVAAGCSDVIFLSRPGTTLTIEFDGGAPRHVRGSTALTISGGHVGAFALHGRRSETGVFDCL
jgi:hypothetical protein